MFALIAIAFTVGLVDSVNPSTVGPALYLAAGKNASRSLALFTLGVFGVYTAGGVALALGPGQAVLALLTHPGRRAVHLVELVLGAAAIPVAAMLWRERERVASRFARPVGASTPGGHLLLGAVIMAVELPTAFPYFGVIATVVGSGRNVADQILLLLIFNAAFVAPLVAILVLRILARGRGEQTLASWLLRLDRHAAALIPALVLAIGIVLLVLGATGL